MAEHDSTASTDFSPVQIHTIADLRQLRALRAVVETLALLGDFTLDDVADARMAVDEVATTLILSAVPGSTLSCEISIDPATMTVTISAVSAANEPPDQSSFGWQVLHALTDSIRASQQGFDPTVSGYPTTVEFTRVRGDRDR